MRAVRQRGSSMIEVLVSLVVLSIGLLGLAAMQLNALKFNQLASVRSHATFLAYEMADRMRAARGDAQAGLYNLAADAALPCDIAAEACLPFQRDLAEWRANLAAQLPQGVGGISQNGSQITIVVQWDEARVGESQAQQFSFVTRI